MAGVLGFTAIGLGAGIASAAPPAPVVAGCPQDHDGQWGHGGDGGDWNNGGNWNNGANWGPGGWGCVTGPFGFVTFCP
jgi:hypothetical protein